MSDDLRGQDLKWAYWINTHRDELYRAGRLVGVIIVSLIWLIFFVYLVKYIRHYRSTQTVYDTIGDTSVNFNVLETAQPITVLEAEAVEATTEAIDVYAVVKNPNRYHVGRFSYTFTVQGETFHFSDGIVMPNEEVYFTIHGLTGVDTAAVTFKVDEMIWQRTKGATPLVHFAMTDLKLSASELSNVSITTDTTTIADPTTNDAVDEFATPEEESETSGRTPGEPLTQLSATVTNGSPYGFKNVRFIGVLKDEGGTIIGIQQVTLSDFKSFASAPLQFHWQRRFAFNTTAEIISLTDYWNRDNLIYPGEGS